MSQNDVVWESPGMSTQGTQNSSDSNGVTWETGGDASQATPQPPQDPRAIFGQDAMNVAGKVGSRILDNIKGMPAALNPVPQNTAEKVGAVIGAPAPVTRMVTGILSALGGITQVPAAIRDINASPDPASAYQQTATDTAGDMLTVAGTEKLGEFAKGIDPKALGSAAKETALETGKAALPDSVKQALKFKERYDAATSKGTKVAPSANPAPANVAPVQQDLPLGMGSMIGPEPTEPVGLSRERMPTQQGELPLGMGTQVGADSPVITDPVKIKDTLDSLREKFANQKAEPKGKAPAVDAEAMKDRLASLDNPTDANTLRSRLDEVNNPPASAQEIRDRLDDISNPSDAATLKSRLKELEPEKPTTVGSKAGSEQDTQYFQRAKAILPDDAPLSKVASKAQALKQQGSDFEETFNQPLSNYQDPDGNFNMRDFLQEVVKPGTEPPAHVISRVFGSDGVKLVQDVSGRPIEKWEPTGPTKAERAAPKTEDKMVTGSPQQYLKLVGANEASVLKTPEDVKTVNFFRNKIRNGEAVTPSEVHMDENNNVVGADGRHRALAAAKEGVQKFKVVLKRHPFEQVKQ